MAKDMQRVPKKLREQRGNKMFVLVQETQSAPFACHQSGCAVMSDLKEFQFFVIGP